jgi:DNA-binding CsgD family transcriptional regulator
LSRRELDVMRELGAPREETAGQGRSNMAVAAALRLSPSTVGVLLSRAAKKLGLATRRDVTEMAERLAAAL